MKTCISCNQRKTLDCFYKCRTKENSIKSICKTCTLDRQKKYDKKSRDELSDVYIKRLFIQGTSLKYSDISQKLVETYRLLVSFKRLIRGELEKTQ